MRVDCSHCPQLRALRERHRRQVEELGQRIEQLEQSNRRHRKATRSADATALGMVGAVRLANDHFSAVRRCFRWCPRWLRPSWAK